MPKLLYNSFKFISTLTLLALFLVLSYYYSQVQKSPAIASRTSSDVIAIRVIPNYQHYSPQRWYKEQGFAGSPQSLTIDGYEAIKEGRTVYVNAANISDQGTPDPNDDILYTNIYLMSYNQDADSDTIAIVNQLLQHWHFNTDLQDVGKCVNAEGNLGDVCLIDPECLAGEYCSSAKAKVTRDTRRLADLTDIRILIENYQADHGHYPILKAGSYLSHITLSVWPSWQKVFAQELKQVLHTDPINRLGDCGEDRFHSVTCWDEERKQFADPDFTPAPSLSELPTLKLPANSYVYTYLVSPDGSSYMLFGATESGYIDDIIIMAGSTGNQPPQFVNHYLPTGKSGYEYDGYIIAKDNDGDVLTWSSNIPYTGWEDSYLWSNVSPQLEATAINNQKKIHADKAGEEGNYTFTVTINDNRDEPNSITTRTFIIAVINPPPVIEYLDIDYIASATNKFKYQLEFYDPDCPEQYPLNYVFSGNLFNSFSYFVDDADEPYNSFSNEHYKYILNIEGWIDAGSMPANETREYTLAVEDQFKAINTISFLINVINNPPEITAPSRTVIVGHNDLDADPLIITATDPDNNELLPFVLSNTAHGIGIPTGLSWGQVDMRAFQITGTAVDWTPTSKQWPNMITVTDIYGAVSSKSFTITVINNPPEIGAICASASIRWNHTQCPSCHYYSCNSITASDPDGHNIVNYDLYNYPTGLSINNVGVIIGYPTQAGNFNIEVTAIDEYGAISNPKSFSLSVNNYCGDNITQSPNMESVSEDCDDGVNNTNFPCSAAYDSSCTYCDTSCVLHTIEGNFCGDGIVQGEYGEQCDGNTQNCVTGAGHNGAQSCTADCLWGACISTEFCGDGVVNGSEECDDGNINNDDACDNFCKFPPCFGHVDFDKIGVGCYLDTNSIPEIQDDDCQKGKYVCQEDNVFCHNVFTDPNYVDDYALNGGNPIFDQCCLFLAFGTPHDFSGVHIIFPGNDYSCISDNCDGYTDHGNNNFNYLQGPLSTLGFQDLSPWSYEYHGLNNGYQYNCDEVCKMRNNSICVGVGLTDAMTIATACVYDTCDSGPTCNTGANLADTTCKSTFHYWSTHSCWDGAHVFPVKSTACYCF